MKVKTLLKVAAGVSVVGLVIAVCKYGHGKAVLEAAETAAETAGAAVETAAEAAAGAAATVTEATAEAAEAFLK